MLPLLDRFLNPGGPPDIPAIIRRDVEDLLNSRLSSPFGDIGEGEAAYGLADLTVSGRTEGEMLRLGAMVKQCLNTYEPRLKNVRVEPCLPATGEMEHLSIAIEAELAGAKKAFFLELPLKVGVRHGA